MISYFSGRFKNVSVYQKLILLGLLILFSMLIFNFIWFLFVIVTFGQDRLYQIGSLTSVNDTGMILILKISQVVNQISVFILPSFIFSYITDNFALNSLNINNRRIISSSILAIISILMFIPLLLFLIRINANLSLPPFLSSLENWMLETENKANQLTESFLHVFTVGGLVGNLLIIGLFASVGEELLFRGIILNMMKEWTGKINLSVFLSAFLFSAMHLQFFGFLPRFAIGVIFGYVFIWTANLWIPILMHFFFNSVTVIWAYLYTVDIINISVSEIENYNNPQVIILSLILGSSSLYLLYNNSIYAIKINRIRK